MPVSQILLLDQLKPAVTVNQSTTLNQAFVDIYPYERTMIENWFASVAEWFWAKSEISFYCSPLKLFFSTIKAKLSKIVVFLIFYFLTFGSTTHSFLVTTTSLEICNLKCFSTVHVCWSVQFTDSFDCTMFSFCLDIVRSSLPVCVHNPLVFMGH